MSALGDGEESPHPSQKTGCGSYADEASSGQHAIDDLINMFSPSHSSNRSERGARERPRVSGLQAAFPTVMPASLPDSEAYGRVGTGADGMERWQIPESYRRHWERVPDILKQIPVHMKGHQSASMTLTPEHEGRMYGESKCFSLLSRGSLEFLAGPYEGMTYCFIAECLSEIPDISLKVLYFFDNVRKIMQSQDRSPYVFPTDKIGLTICRKNKKTVTGLYAKGERGTDELQPSISTLESQDTEFISAKQILEGRAHEQPDETRCPISEVKLRVGFTGVEYLDKDGQKRRKTFIKVSVTPAANLAFWAFIYEVVLSPPKMGSPQYANLVEFYNVMKSTLEEILNYEMVVNLGILQQDFGSLDDYRFNSGGVLGVITILSPFGIPAKINHVIHKHDPAASEIKIIGMPHLNFKADNLNTSDWISTMHRNITAGQRMDDRDAEILQRYNMLKDKSIFEEAKQEAVGGWPVQVARDGTIHAYGLPPFPLMLLFNTHGAPNKSYDSWFSSIGGKDALPIIVRALLRAYLVDTEGRDEFPEISHFLNDTRKADPVLIFNTYFSPSVDPFKSLVILNSQKIWWEGFMKDMKRRRELGMPVSDMVKALDNYIMGVICNLHGMIDGGGFRSKAISQMRFICETMNFGQVCKFDEASIARRLHYIRSRASSSRRYDSMDSTLGALLNTFQEINRSFYLNSANLVCLFEIMISKVLFGFGGLNDTWTYFFCTLMVMSGNGHFKSQVNGTVIQDNRKPNTTGTDTVANREGDIINALYDIIGIPHNQRDLQDLNCTRFTKTVWEQISTATAAGNELLTQPSRELNGRTMIMTEFRGGDSKEPILQNVILRNEATSQAMAFNSVDPERNGVRRLAEKMKVSQAELVLLCTNVLDTLDSSEHTRSGMVVSPVLWPGSGIPNNKRSRQQFQDIGRDIHTGRHRELDDKEGVAYFLVFSRIFARLYPGLINRVLAIPSEISEGASAELEWGSFYLQQYAEAVMDPTVRENFSRIVQGYTSRGVALSVWIKTIHHLGRCKNPDNKQETVKELMTDLMADVLHIGFVPLVLTCMMSRSVNMGALLMVMAIAENMGVPVVSWKGLNHFFDSDTPPTEEGVIMEDYIMIRSFVVECIDSRRFCAAEDCDWDVQSNISCYITGEGRENLLPLHENSGFLRFVFNKDKSGDENTLFNKIATRFLKLKGRDMFKTCHMGPERVSYKLAFEDLLKYTPDFRGLASHKTYFSKKHFAKMGLMSFLPGMPDYGEVEPPPFARHVVFKEEDQVKSEGLGVNLWSLLTMVSLAGEILVHPSVNDLFSMGLTTQILAKSPMGCTPGNMPWTRVFDRNSKPQRLFVPDECRPAHYLRPEDDTFPSTGILSLARSMDEWLPEDMLHCPWLFRLAKTLKCNLKEVPAAVIKSQYYLQPNKHYPFHVPGDETVFGSVYVNIGHENVVFTKYDRADSLDGEYSGEIAGQDFYDWEDYISSQGYVLMPLVERGGACVVVPIEEEDGKIEKKLGVLIPFPELNSQWNHNDGNYQALVREDNSIVKVFFKDLMDCIVAVGTVLYLDMKVIQDERFNHPGRRGKFLQTRLNVPNEIIPQPGKIYVTGLYRRNKTRTQAASSSSVTFAVNPWDVIPKNLFEGDQESVVKFLD